MLKYYYWFSNRKYINFFFIPLQLMLDYTIEVSVGPYRFLIYKLNKLCKISIFKLYESVSPPYKSMLNII